MPLVGAEVQRINSAFRTVSLELSGVLTVLRDLDLASVGTPACDPAVESAMTDLRQVLSGLQATAEECSQAMSRHGDLREPGGGGAADGSAGDGGSADET